MLGARPILLFGMVTKTTAEGAISYFDMTGVGLVALAVVALFLVLRNQRRRLREQMHGRKRRARVEQVDLAAKLRALEKATQEMDRRLHR